MQEVCFLQAIRLDQARARACGDQLPTSVMKHDGELQKFWPFQENQLDFDGLMHQLAYNLPFRSFYHALV